MVLCDGVSKDPILVPSVSSNPRSRPATSCTQRQTEQDALNEFAGKLVNPPERHVAHVRMPPAYHQVKLAPPSASVAPAGQVDQVRKGRRRSITDLVSGMNRKDRLSPNCPALNKHRGQTGDALPQPRSQPDPTQEVSPEPTDDEEASTGQLGSDADDGMQDQDGGSGTTESEGRNVFPWDAFVEEKRRKAEHEGKRFVVVSDREIAAEDIPKPGDLIISRTTYSYDNEAVAFRILSAIIDRDTGEVTWTDETFPDPKEYKERGIKVGELEAIDISMWDAYVEDKRCDAERNGNRFIAVSDEEIVVEETKPGALSVNRTIPPL